MGHRVPLFELNYGEAERRAADRVLADAWMTSGPRVRRFEELFGEMLGARNVVAVSSCTAALHLALAAHDVGPGDEVIVPALTFVAPANAVLARGATPVFADILSLEEPNIDPASVARVMGPRAKAVIPVHYGGYPCDMAALKGVVAGRAVIIEDSAHACVTRTDEGMCGTLADAGTFSFFSNKNLSVGEGGALIMADDDLSARARRMSSHGMSTGTLDRHRGHAYSYGVDVPGFNFRWDELRAAIAIEKLARLPDELAARRRLGGLYRARFAARSMGIVVPFADPAFAEAPPHIFPVVLPANAHREAIMDAMRAAGVQTSIHYPLIPGFELYANGARGEWARAATYCGRVLTLPLYPAMTGVEIDIVVDALCAAMAAAEAA